jgi:MscS family membrane protein
LDLLLIPAILLALWLLLGTVGWILKRTGRPGKKNLAKLAFSPPGWMLVILVHWLCMRQVGVPLLFRYYQDKVMMWAFLIVMVWLAMRLVDRAVDSLTRRVQENRQGFAVSIFSLVRQGAKVILILIAILITLAGLGFNIGTALAGVGIGGIALALGAQKSLEHLIGGITVLSDRVLHIGDRCRLGSQIGTVEDISLRSTKIRTLEGSLLAVPNGVMATINLENLSNRNRFLFNPVIGVRYETTAEQLECLLEQLRNLLAQQPLVDPESRRVCFKSIGASSLELEIFAEIVTGDFLEFVRIREELLLAIMRIVEGVGTGFAFPSQTLYLRRDAKLPSEHS